MTVSDDTIDEPPAPLVPPYLRWAITALLLTGGTAGATAVLIEKHPQSLIGILVCAGLALGALAASIAAWKALRKQDQREQTAPRVSRSRNLIFASFLLGGVIGAAMALAGLRGGTEPSAFAAFADTPLSPTFALVLLAGLALTLWLSIKWHLSIDEHEMAAYNFGAVTAIYTYFFASVGWWLAWRGAFTPEPDGKAIFGAVMAVWLLGWLYKRSR